MDYEVARQILLDHSKHPRNKTADAPLNFDRDGECRNPLCGDHVKIYLSIDQGKINDVKLQIKACTMCTASASLMSQLILGRKTFEILKTIKIFSENLLKTNADWPLEILELEAFSHLKLNPARIPCALIPWYALKKAIE